MFHQKSINIGRIFGIPIGLDFSWFFIFIFFSWILATGYFPTEFKDWPKWLYLLAGVLTSTLLFISVLLHELGHSIVAMYFKIKVRQINLMVFGGIAKFDREPNNASSELLVALAGPFVNFIIGSALYYLEPLFGSSVFILAIVKFLVYINIVLAIFNLVPGFPLDGGRVFRAIVWGITHNQRKATIMASGLGRIIAFTFIFWGALEILRGNTADGIWVIFIGWLLDSAASAQIQQSNIREMLEGHKAKEAMNPNFAVIPSDTPLQFLMDYHIIGEGRRYIIVKDGEQFLGLLTLHHLKEVPQEQWSQVKVRDVMLTMNKLKQVSVNTDLWGAFLQMQQDGVNQIPVLENNKIVGVLSRDNIFNFLNLLH